MSALAPTLQAFFTDRLIRQRQASNHTLASYRDTLRLLVRFAAERRKVEPVKLEISDLDSALISAFLDHRERECGNSVRTRNTRLTAIRSLFRYAALRHPEHAEVIQHVLAIPPKRFARRLVSFLTDPEVDALLSAPDRTTWVGRRDHTLFATAVQTGLRASELIGLRITDVHLGVGPHVSCLGKGRKQRITRSPSQWWRCSGPGSVNAVNKLAIWSLLRVLEGCSAATHSNIDLQNALQRPVITVRPYEKRGSAFMCCGTRQQ